MHVLGFSSILYDKFIDSEGVIIPLDKVINEAKTLDG
jgi:hypothetical protein